MNSMTNRLDNAYKHRKEEQVIAAILHMSSPWGFFALISSGIVWAISKSRSRFLMIQALQAFLFQLFSLLAFAGMFFIFMVGFYYAAFSGLIARTGVTEPELTSNLITAMIVGSIAIFFFRFILPLWGLWAGIQVLRGKSYHYPILGAAVIRYTSRQPFVVKTESHIRNAPESENERIIAGLGHAAMFVGFSLFLCPILWTTAKIRSRFLSHHLFQASIFQIAATILLSLFYFVVWGGGALFSLLRISGLETPLPLYGRSEIPGISYLPIGLGILFLLFLLTCAICVVIATVQAFRGKAFHYPFIGKWLLRYVQ